LVREDDLVDRVFQAKPMFKDFENALDITVIRYRSAHMYVQAGIHLDLDVIESVLIQAIKGHPLTEKEPFPIFEYAQGSKS